MKRISTMKTANLSLNCLLLILILSSCSKENTADINIGTSSLIESLVDENHTSEGFLVKTPNKIIHFFRSDEGNAGNHIGNSGKISKRESYDNGMNWTESEMVFNDEYDDRNIRGGITDNGKIVLFFRRYDALSQLSIDLNYIISEDGGDSWTERQSLNFNLDFVEEVWIDNFVKVENNKYLLPIHGISYCEIRYFNIINNQLIISEKVWDWDYTDTTQFKIDEPSFSFLGNGKIIGLFRDESKNPGSNYYQVTSSDLGSTWTAPIRTNICEPFFSPSPLIFFNKSLEKIIVVGTDRRLANNGNYSSEDSKIWVYSNNIEEVFDNPNGYNLINMFDRPSPSNFRLYGYPTYVNTNHNSHLIIFTESSYDGNTEDADFYQFEIYNRQ
jgi:hypothetical protein